MAEPQTAGEMAKLYGRFPKDTKLCPSCYWVLQEGDDDDGNFLWCSNEMCLDNTQYYNMAQVYDK